MASSTENTHPPPTEPPPSASGGVPAKGSREEKIAYLREFAQKRGFEYVSGEYSGKDTPLQWKCAQGHHITTRWDAFRRSRYHCPECSKRAIRQEKTGSAKKPSHSAKPAPRTPVNNPSSVKTTPSHAASSSLTAPSTPGVSSSVVVSSSVIVSSSPAASSSSVVSSSPLVPQSPKTSPSKSSSASQAKSTPTPPSSHHSKSDIHMPPHKNGDHLKQPSSQEHEIDIPLVRCFSHDDLTPICAGCALLFSRYLPSLKKEYRPPQDRQECVYCGQSVSNAMLPDQLAAVMAHFPQIQGKIDIINYKIAHCKDPAMVLVAEEMAEIQAMPDQMKHLHELAVSSPRLSLTLAVHLGHSDALFKACLKDPRCAVEYATTVLTAPHEYLMRTLKAQGRWAEYAHIAAHYQLPITDQEYAKIKACGAGSAFLLSYFAKWDPNTLVTKMKENAPLTLVEREMPKGLLSCLRGPILKAVLAYDTPTAREVFRLVAEAPMAKIAEYGFIKSPSTPQKSPLDGPPAVTSTSPGNISNQSPVIAQDFYFIDLNNFISRSRDKVPARQMQAPCLWNALAKQFAQSNAYHVFMYYSRQNAEFCHVMKKLAEKDGIAAQIEWYEEADMKGQTYSDIDTALAAKAVETMSRQKNGILVLYLGSGDGDFKPVIQLAKEHRIAVEVVAIAEDSLSYRLKELVNSPIFLFKH